MNRNPKPWREYGRYGSVGIELVLSILIGWWVGHWVDAKWLGGHGYGTAIGFVAGTYAGFRALFVVAAHMTKDIERAERQARGDDPWAPPSPPDESAPIRRDDEAPHDDA